MRRERIRDKPDPAIKQLGKEQNDRLIQALQEWRQATDAFYRAVSGESPKVPAAGPEGPKRLEPIADSNRSEPRGPDDGIPESIIERAVEVVGDRVEAMRWLGTPVRALGFATPISVLATREGALRVMDVLGQMEHGIW